jgi:hypothetical protein
MTKLALLFTLGLLGMPACVSSHSCTEVGCADGATIILKTPDDTWAEAQYRLTIVVDNATYVCSLQSPYITESIHRVECDATLGALSLVWRAVTVCEEPVQDRFTLEAALPGTPKEVHVTFTRDDATLLDQSVPLSYETTRPNGPECGPICQQARVELTVS